MEDDRTIGVLRLRVPGREVVPRVTLLVEDALRTASLPPTGGRLVIVRRVDLGVIDPRRPSGVLADRLRDLLRGAWGRARHGASAGAAAADAVWFRSAEEAHAALLVRALRGAGTPVWPWRRAVPLAFAGDTPSVEPRRVLASARRLPAGLASVARVVDGVARAGEMAALVAQVTPGDAAWLAPEAEGRVERALDAAALGVVARAAARWPEAAASVARALPAERIAWAALALVADEPARVIDPRLPALAAEVARVWRARVEGAVERIVRRERGAGGSAEDGDVEPRSGAGARRGDRAEEPPGVAGPEARAPSTPERAAEAGPAEPEVSLAELLLPRRTRLGGLLFLLAPLARLGLIDLMEREPRWADAELGLRVLHAAAERAGWPDDDALRPALALRDPGAALPERFVAPARWWALVGGGAARRRIDPLAGREGRRVGPLMLAIGAVGRCPPAPRREAPGWRVTSLAGRRRPRRRRSPGGRWGRERELGPVPLAPAAWVDALDLWLRRHAGLPLVDVVRRDAAIVATATHIDVVLPPGAVDVRLRRAGLDLDPGWVAWWGRVVAFHYREGADGR